MKISSLLSSTSSKLKFSFEFFPPKDQQAFNNFLSEFNFFSDLSPIFVSVTYGAGGSTKEKTFDAVKYINSKFNIPVMPHLTALTHTEEEIHNLLLSYSNIGIENILALRGDVPKDLEGKFDISKARFKNALEFTRFITDRFPNKFCIATSSYPEGFPEFNNIEKEIEYLKEKFDSGADFGITQMFFDNSYYLNFIEKCQKKGINKPIIPGIMPISNISTIMNFAQKVGAKIPQKIIDKFNGKITPEDQEKVGLEIAYNQIQELYQNGVKFFHIYTLNRKNIIKSLVSLIIT
jgi:methylenetetrahydrofolate reductase (NADPH)